MGEGLDESGWPGQYLFGVELAKTVDELAKNGDELAKNGDVARTASSCLPSTSNFQNSTT
jgi:hypothetical protein